jgi:tetratricopeptide (TPR) repeat protein
MKIRKIAAITLLVLSSLAATGVAPSKSELEAMYDKAFREFDANNYEQALKDLDAIDARQPDLAESANLRGVIQMRQKDYANAETALQKALAADPKFWNARFNLAEIPFLQKNWPEARKRFQELLNGNASELQGEATQLIQYKILITYLMEGKDNMVDALKGKFELTPETPALQYAIAAIALNKKDENAAKQALTAAEKNFSPQLNKLFAESLYEVGWLEKPAGQTRAALELNSAAERAAKTKEFAKAKYDEAEQALQQRDMTAARKLIDEADAADPNQAAIINLRGEILLEQKDYEAAENEFKKAAKIDPKFRDAQYNLAQIPFKKKDYAKARERFESLFSTTSGVDKDRAAQLIKFKVYLTYLLEGKDARAQKMMEQFQFTGDTPALYYAQAAWEFKHDNAAKANDWVTSARKIYSPALNGVFSDSFFDLGWLQTPAAEATPAAALAEAGQPEAAASVVEPTPIPTITLAKNDAEKSTDPLSIAAQEGIGSSTVAGMEATNTSSTAQSPAASSMVGASASPSVETPVASTASPAAAKPVIASPSESENTTPNEENNVSAQTSSVAASASPATVLAPAQVRAWAGEGTSVSEMLSDRNTLVVSGLLLAGLLTLGFVMVPEIRRRMGKSTVARTFTPVTSPSFVGHDDDAETASTESFITPTRLAGGPPQVSLQLRATEPALRRAVMPVGKGGRASGVMVGGNGNGHGHEHSHAVPVAAVATAPAVQSFVRPEPVAPAPIEEEPIAEASFDESNEGLEFVSEVTELPLTDSAPPAENFVSEPPYEPEVTYEPEAAYEPEVTEEAEFVDEENAPAWEAAESEETYDSEPAGIEELAPMDEASAFADSTDEFIDAPALDETAGEFVEAEPDSMPVMANESMPEPTASMEETSEPIGQGQPVPYLTSADAPAAEVAEPAVTAPQFTAGAAMVAGLAGAAALRHPVENSPVAPSVESNEAAVQQSTTPATMPQPTSPTPAPSIRTGPAAPAGGAAPQPAPAMQQQHQPTAGVQQGSGGMHTAVQLTFSFEIASLQLTPNFKMGMLQLKPTSKIVTMRLAPSQHPQPAMNLQVTFEIATVQLNGNSIGMVRLTPSQQQRPGVSNSPSFNITGLQLVSGSDAAPVQLTPSQQGGASVLVTSGFQIATVEFSPSFEIASIILNSTSKSASVQLPGAGASAIEGAPVFDIANVQLGGNGEISVMQLHPQGAAPKRA